MTSGIIKMQLNFQNIEAMWNFFKTFKLADQKHVKQKIFLILPHAICWSIWRHQNDAIFRGDKVYIENICIQAASFLYNWSCHVLGVSVEIWEKVLEL